MQKLVLWDIDGTLLHTGGVSGEAMRAAMARFYGEASNQEHFSYAGKTDSQIILETFPHRQQTELLDVLSSFTNVYLEELVARRKEMLARAHVLAGVITLLERLAHAPAVQSVLTGNIKASAFFKLEALDLIRFIDLEVGAFGSDHHRRDELVPIAVARATQRYEHTFARHDVVVIGDTPHDVACGRAGGARTIAVATGTFTVDDLRATGADIVLPNLDDTTVALAAILG